MSCHLNELITLLSRDPLFEEQVAELQGLEQRVQSNELIISVIGQFKRGKSSVINRMLGEPLLPVGIIPLTSVITELYYGERSRAEVCFLNGTSQEIRPEEIGAYCSEQENSGNRKQVASVRLWTPGQPFGPGIVLVDTPGVGSVWQNNTEATYQHIAESDAVLFLLSVDSPVSETEREFLLKVKEFSPKFFFAVNKSDLVSADDLQAYLSFCEKVLSGCMDCDVRLRPISAVTGEGVRELTASLRSSLSAGHDTLLNESLLRKRKRIVEQAEAKLLLARQAAALPSSELSEKLKRFDEKEQLMRSFEDNLQVLSRHHTDRLVRTLREPMEREGTLMKQEMPAQCEALGKELSGLSLGAFQNQAQLRLDEMIRKRLTELNEKGIALLTEGYEEVTAQLAAQAAETERYLADFLRSEFQVEYPVSDQTFEVSQKDDFFLRVGFRNLPRLSAELVDHLLPRKKAEARFLDRCKKQAEQDIDCNINNMLYNYRYKMQESLRPFCRELGDRTQRTLAEMERLRKLLQGYLDDAERLCTERTSALEEIMAALHEE